MIVLVIEDSRLQLKLNFYFSQALDNYTKILIATGDVNSYTGTVFRKALHSLCWDIAEKGGLPVIFSMMRVLFIFCIFV